MGKLHDNKGPKVEPQTSTDRVFPLNNLSAPLTKKEIDLITTETASMLAKIIVPENLTTELLEETTIEIQNICQEISKKMLILLYMTRARQVSNENTSFNEFSHFIHSELYKLYNLHISIYEICKFSLDEIRKRYKAITKRPYTKDFPENKDTNKKYTSSAIELAQRNLRYAKFIISTDSIKADESVMKEIDEMANPDLTIDQLVKKIKPVTEPEILILLAKALGEQYHAMTGEKYMSNGERFNKSPNYHFYVEIAINLDEYNDKPDLNKKYKKLVLEKNKIIDLKDRLLRLQTKSSPSKNIPQ